MSNTPQPPEGQSPINPGGAFTPLQPPGYGGSTPPGGPGAKGPQGGSPQGPGYPPMPWGYPPQQPKGRSFARTILVTLASIIFLGSIVANIYLIAIVTALSGSGMVTQLIETGDETQTVAVIPIRGMIDDDMSKSVRTYLKRAAADPNVKAIVLEIDSPGGTVTASDEIYTAINKLRKERSIPVVASMGGLATSGGYYIACSADHIVAQRTTMTGNIGVLLFQVNLHKFLEENGIKETTITASEAKFKNAGSPLSAPKEEDRAYIQAIIDQAHSLFKGVVKAGRPNLKKPVEEVANGKIFMGQEAMDVGLVDTLGYATDAYAEAAKRANLSSRHVVRYTRPATVAEQLGLAKGGVPDVNVGGVNINVGGDLRSITSPRMMYYWDGR